MQDIDEDNVQPITVRNETPMAVTPGTTNPYLRAATAENTRRSYRSVIRRFERWGGRLPTERDTLVRYLLEHAQHLNARTLEVHLTALGHWHRYQGLHDPTRDAQVRKTLDGIRRVHGSPKQKAKALRLEHLATMLAWLNTQPDSPRKFRDLALLHVGFFGAFRRSELVALRVEHLHWEPEGLIILLPHSKTDQQRQGVHRALPKGPNAICPVGALRQWLDSAGIKEGPVFRGIDRWRNVQPTGLTPGAVNLLIKSWGEACGFDFVPELSSHSFRRGLSTSAAREKIDFELIKKQGGWKSDATVWEYIEEGQQLTDNAALLLFEKVASLMSLAGNQPPEK